MTYRQKNEIRALYAEGERKNNLAEMYGASISKISRVIRENRGGKMSRKKCCEEWTLFIGEVKPEETRLMGLVVQFGLIRLSSHCPVCGAAIGKKRKGKN